jgi:hypothetical protein
VRIRPDLLWEAVGLIALVGAALGILLARAEGRVPRPAPQEGAGAGAPRAALAFALLTLLLYVNQVLFNAWALRPGEAQVAELRAALPAVFFHLAPDHAPVRWLAAALGELPDLSLHLPGALRPRGGLASLSLLRAQAALEVPWALMAWQLVARLLDPAAAARWARGWAGPLAAVSHTLVLCAIEELLHNPYTDQDLILRLPGLWLAIHLLRWSAAGPALERPPSAVHLAAFFVGLGAASVLVLGGNLILLLYNLGWLSPFAPVLLVATLVLLAALRRAALPAPASRAPLVSTLVELGRFFLFTFGPAAMAIRYGLSHARALPLSALAGGIAVVGALVFGLRAARARLSPAERAPHARALGLGLLLALPAASVDLAAPLGLPASGAPDLWLLYRGAQALVAVLLGYGLMAARDGALRRSEVQ